jgi:hypothetical protein
MWMMHKIERQRQQQKREQTMCRHWWNVIIPLLLLVPAEAFVTHQLGSIRVMLKQHKQPVQRHKKPLCSIWRHWIPETDFFKVLEEHDLQQQERRMHPPNKATVKAESYVTPPSVSTALQTVLTVVILSLLVAIPQAGIAVSGGGLDFAGTDISGKDFSNSNYKGKDFTQVIAKGTNFAKSNLQGCRFYKAYLVRTKNIQNGLPCSVLVFGLWSCLIGQRLV